MTEVPRVELPSLQAQSDQVLRMGAARAAARDTVERADQDYELELHSRRRTEEVAEAERVASAGDRRQRHDDDRPDRERRDAQDDDPDDEPHILDVRA
jgi:hypothetical protein